VPGPEFFQTVMGKQFYDGTMPRIAKALERIADAMEKQQEPLAAAPELQSAVAELKERVELLEDVAGREDRRK
jgi:hypothetical protein